MVYQYNTQCVQHCSYLYCMVTTTYDTFRSFDVNAIGKYTNTNWPCRIHRRFVRFQVRLDIVQSIYTARGEHNITYAGDGEPRAYAAYEAASLRESETTVGYTLLSGTLNATAGLRNTKACKRNSRQQLCSRSRSHRK